MCKSPRCLLPSFKSNDFSVQKKKRKINFQDGHHGGHLGPDRNYLAIFDLQVAPMLPTEFQVNWLFGSGDEAKNIFSRWSSRLPSLNYDRNDLKLFLFYKSPRCFLPSFKSIGFAVQEKKRNRFLRCAPRQPSWISDRNDFSYF